MVKESGLLVVLSIILCCALVNLVNAKTVSPAQIEPYPDLYSIASTYPGASNIVNYNASPNPQYTSNFNNFNEPTPQPSNQILGNYQNMEYQQKPPQQPPQQPPQKSLEELVTGNYSPSLKTNNIESDLKNTLVSMKDNLGFMADTQRLLLNSFKVQQQQYNDIEEKLRINEFPAQRNVGYGVLPSYGPPPQSQYPPIPTLPPLPYGHPTNQAHTVHHHKKHSHKKGLGKLFKKHNRRGGRRGLALVGRVSESTRMERHAAMTLAYIKNGIVNALWTALVVACVKLAPILLFGFKLMFKSVLPLTGLALFGANRGIFPNQLNQLNQFKDDRDDDNVDIDDEEDDEDDDDESDEEEKDVSDEKDTASNYR